MTSSMGQPGGAAAYPVIFGLLLTGCAAAALPLGSGQAPLTDIEAAATCDRLATVLSDLDAGIASRAGVSAALRERAEHVRRERGCRYDRVKPALNGAFSYSAT